MLKNNIQIDVSILAFTLGTTFSSDMLKELRIFNLVKDKMNFLNMYFLVRAI